ncbi:unnamed protein product [Phaeothamnion confervicola]
MAKTVQNKRMLYVGGLEETVKEEALHAAFVPFGEIAEVQIPKNWEKGENRGFGFVQYEEEEDALAALENMDGSELFGRVLKVNLARPMKHKLGSGKAVWTAEEWFQQMNAGEERDHEGGGDDGDGSGDAAWAPPGPDSLQPAPAAS